MTLNSKNALQAGLAMIAGVLVIVLLALTINLNFGLPFNITMGFPPSQDYSLNASFKDANGLNRGAQVVIGGHEVGDVVGVRSEGREAVVSMRVRSQFAPIRQGTIARIRYSTLLAQKYVELTPNSYGRELDSGTTIASADTVTPVDFDQFLSTLDPETRDRLQKVVQNAGGGLEGRQTAINDFLDQLYGLSAESRPGLSTLHQHDDDLGRITTNLAVTSKRLAQSRQQLGDLVQTADDVNQTMADHDVALTRFFTHLANVSTDFDQTLNGNEQNFHNVVVGLDPLIGDLNNTLGIVYPYYHNDKPNLTEATAVLLPRVSSAVSDGDPNGNFLRQYLIIDCKYDNQPCPPAPPKVGTPVQPNLPAPNLTPCPLPTPKLPVPKLTPLPTPTVCPTISPIPTPSLPCLPVPTPALPKAPVPTPSVPNICPSLGAPGLPGLPNLPTPPIPNPLAVVFGE